MPELPQPPSQPTPSPRPPGAPATTTTTTTATATSTAVAAPAPSGAGLSVAQMCGGALAAVTSAVAASFLGVAGTLIGAAVGSIVSTIAAAIYSTSLSRAARASRTLVVKHVVAPATGATAVDQASVEAAGPVEPVEPVEVSATPSAAAPAESVWRRLRWQPLAAAAGVVFVVAMGLVTVSELGLGHPIGNSNAKGVTLTNVSDPAPQQPTPAPTTSPTGTEDTTPTPTGTEEATPTPTGPTDSPAPTGPADSPAPTGDQATSPPAQSPAPGGGQTTTGTTGTSSAPAQPVPSS